jgi:type I restriction enzyme M protein
MAVIEIEKEKLLYFILTYPQKTVLVKTGEKDAEKRFLGYEFSNRRGNEGIHPIQRGKTVDECTRLFDDKNLENPEKASTYIYRAFLGDYSSPIHESLKENISRVRLVDMLTFERASFEKTISLAIKKKVKIESKWEQVKLGEIISLEYGKSLQESKRIKGIYPVMGSNGISGYHNEYIVEGPAIIVGRKGTAGKVTFISNNCYPIDTTFYIQVKDKTNLKYLYYTLSQLDLESKAGGTGVPGINRNEIYDIKIPLPPKEIQEKIVAEIEELEKQAEKAKEEIREAKEKIEQIFTDVYSKANTVYRLSNDDIFSVSIGKRVIEADLNENGEIPVYSANVFEAFGFINKYLIKDFTVPSVLWGIDGDWMVNYMPENKPFYPTDHCGILRIKNNKAQPKYLAWALHKEGKKQGFSRTLRASIDRIQSLSIKFPPFSEQQKIVAEIEKIEAKITALEQELSEIPEQKEQILKKYL